MLKLVIADDERIIRETISTIIDWKQYDIELVGLCKNGLEAYDMILDESPDIVLTDIRMPGMDGLELIQRISQTDLNTQFIILSGYGEFEYAKTAEEKGFKVIIAGAGMAAHLPGMCAALFPMPVIGIPMSGKNLEGMDALYSIVQMPPGIPVATVAIDGGMNAAILAAKMLAMSDPELLEKLKAYSAEMKDTVQAKADRLAEVGYEEYLNNK